MTLLGVYICGRGCELIGKEFKLYVCKNYTVGKKCGQMKKIEEEKVRRRVRKRQRGGREGKKRQEREGVGKEKNNRERNGEEREKKEREKKN